MLVASEGRDWITRASWLARSMNSELWVPVRDLPSLCKVERDQGRHILSASGPHMHICAHIHMCTHAILPKKNSNKICRIKKNVWFLFFFILQNDSFLIEGLLRIGYKIENVSVKRNENPEHSLHMDDSLVACFPVNDSLYPAVYM